VKNDPLAWFCWQRVNLPERMHMRRRAVAAGSLDRRRRPSLKTSSRQLSQQIQLSRGLLLSALARGLLLCNRESPDLLGTSHGHVRSSSGGLIKKFACHGYCGRRVHFAGCVQLGSCPADPDLIGKQYGEAKGLLRQSGLRLVVATIFRDRLSQHQCYVVGMSKITSRDSSARTANGNEVLVNLNCYAEHSDNGTPGFSKGTLRLMQSRVPETHDEVDKKWKASPEGQQWCAEIEGEHPEWGT
jgi:hypothetical protein